MLQILVISYLPAVLESCYAKSHSVTKPVQHEIEIKGAPGSSIVVDKVPNGRIIQEQATGDARTKFVSYQVEFTDSAALAGIFDEKLKQARSIYFQYKIDRDWNLLRNGDSIKPVFFQILTKKSREKDGMVFVFEIPSTFEPDTLVYHDSFGDWGMQKLVFKN